MTALDTTTRVRAGLGCLGIGALIIAVTMLQLGGGAPLYVIPVALAALVAGTLLLGTSEADSPDQRAV